MMLMITDLSLVCRSHASSTSWQSVSTMTRLNPFQRARQTPSRKARASAMKGLDTPGYFLHAATTKPPLWLRMTTPPPVADEDIAASVLTFTTCSGGGVQRAFCFSCLFDGIFTGNSNMPRVSQI
uniref:Uncharacterized protein n=1 Tax=Arundo donax TaxID=35708 RepID=A0A0A9UAM1_ARUDO